MKKKIIIIVTIILIGGGLFGAKYGYDFMRYEKIIPTITIQDVDLSTIEDGTYEGDFNAYILRSIVSVTVKDHEISDVEFIKHKYERGQKAEAILDVVISKQSLDVDVVSGATNSSKVILKSIENALTSDKQ